MAINQAKQALVFTTLWIVYASSYLLRKPLGVIKSDLESVNGLSKADLGWLDSSFLLPYALISMLFGNLGDKYGSRLVLTISLFVLGLTQISFGYWNSPIVYGILLFINGSCQATLWGNCIKGLTGWFHPNNKTTVFGIYGTCTFAGGILGTALAVQLQRTYPGDFRMVFAVPSVIVILVSILVHFAVKSPEEFGESPEVSGQSLPKHVTEKPVARNLSFLETWKLPMVPELCWTMFGMKLVRYCLYMWLPMYLNQNLNYSKVEAGMFSTAFEIGGVVGSAFIGVFVDRILNGRACYGVFLALCGTAVSLCLFEVTSTWGKFYNCLFLFIAGACQCGPDSLVAGSMASEIGARENAQSAVSGVVNGFGSVGSIVEGPFIAFILSYFGWGATFYAMVICTVIGALAIFKAARAELRLQSSQAI